MLLLVGINFRFIRFIDDTISFVVVYFSVIGFLFAFGSFMIRNIFQVFTTAAQDECKNIVLFCF